MTKLAMCRVGATLIWLIVAGISIPAQDVASSRQLTWDELSNPPGSYSESVSLRPVGGRELEYRFIDHGGAPHTDYFLPLADGIELHAPRDAEVRYTVELRRVGDPATMIAGTFSVDTLAPHAPRFTQAPGLHTSPVVLRPEVPESLPSDMASVYVAVQRADGEDSEFSRITSDGVDLAGEPGAVLDYRVSAYALDNAGNRSAVATYRYRIDRSRAVLPAEHPIISPRAGRYANEQILLVDSSGLADISIVLSTPQGDQRRLEYAEMPVIAGTGEFAVTLTATVVSSGEPYRRTVTWSQETRPRMPEQGRTTSSIRVQPPSNPVRYNLEDLPVAPNDPQWLRSAELIPPPDGLRPVVIRYRGDGAEFDTRLAFLLDGRRAPLPHIASTAEPGTITLYSLAETEVQWAPMTETGLGRYSDVVLGSVEIALQDVTATELVSRARYPEGSWTQRTVALGPFRSDPPVAPQDFRDDGVTIAIGTAGEAGELTLIDESSQAEIVRFRGEYPLRWRPPPGFSATLRNERDRAGSVTVNRTPLAPPVVSFQERRLVLSGEGQIFYRIDGSSEAVYQTPLVLSGVSGARRRYRVDAYRIFRGQISPTVTVFPVIDERRPEVPPPRVRGGVARGPADFVSREEAPTVSFSSPYADLVLHYEATSTGEALLPQSDSPVVGDGIILSAPEAQETQWSIRVRGRFAGQERWSPVYRMTVTIDRHPPEAPVLTSDPGTTGIIAFEPPTEEDTSVWYRLRANAPFQRYEGPITINRDRLERALTVSAYTRDLVGNRTMLAETPMLEPLNQEPAPPQLMMNGRLVSAPRVTLSREALLEPLDPEGVRWRIVDGSDTADPGEYRQFESFREPRLLSPGTYRVNAYRERGGERSRVIERIVTIDPERPRKPNVPYLTYASDGRSGTVYWPGAQSEQIFASLVVDSQSDPPVEPFSVSDGTVRWHIPDGASSVSLVYFSVGDAGRRSETEVIRIEAARLRSPAQVSGVQNGERYQSERTIQFTGGGDIRFTATSDGSSPEAVRVSSTRYEEP
ncbi:MAG TPA: hypothetical protein VJ932_11570, partial [Alkalispirochaeta sp.]|nr:hypothetical protein [Alkalispirochaeta sp.]